MDPAILLMMLVQPDKEFVIWERVYATMEACETAKKHAVKREDVRFECRVHKEIWGDVIRAGRWVSRRPLGH